MNAPPFFIVGCSRSGTTLLRMMLTQNETLHIPAESEFLLTLCGQQDLYGDFTQPHQRWFFIRDLQTNEVSLDAYTFPIFGLTIQEAEDAIAEAAPTDFAGASAALFSASARKKGKTRWADKTPHYVHHLGWLAQAFPKAQFIHVIRDARDVAASRRHARFAPSIRASVQWWKCQVKAGRSFASALGNEHYYELFFEELALRPTSTLQALCRWLNLSYTPAMLSFHEGDDLDIPEEHIHLHKRISQPVDTSRVYAWKRELTRREIADAEEVAGDLLEELGYECTGYRVPLWLRGLRAGEHMAKPLFRKAKTSLLRLGTH